VKKTKAPENLRTHSDDVKKKKKKRTQTIYARARYHQVKGIDATLVRQGSRTTTNQRGGEKSFGGEKRCKTSSRMWRQDRIKKDVPGEQSAAGNRPGTDYSLIKIKTESQMGGGHASKRKLTKTLMLNRRHHKGRI